MWSLCSWVSRMASRCRTPARSIWQRKSGPASIASRVRPVSISAEVRSRLSRGSVERHTGQRQPMTGTPCEVPVPKNVSFIRTKIAKINGNARGAARFRMFRVCAGVRPTRRGGVGWGGVGVVPTYVRQNRPAPRRGRRLILVGSDDFAPAENCSAGAISISGLVRKSLFLFSGRAAISAAGPNCRLRPCSCRCAASRCCRPRSEARSP